MEVLANPVSCIILFSHERQLLYHGYLKGELLRNFLCWSLSERLSRFARRP